MKRFSIPIILLVLTLSVTGCGGIGGSMLAAALGGGSMDSGSYAGDTDAYDYEETEDLDDADDYTVDTDMSVPADTDAVISGQEAVTETEDALSTEGYVDQAGSIGNAATDASEAPSTDDLIESSTGPVALPVTPPREGEECDIDAGSGQTMMISMPLGGNSDGGLAGLKLKKSRELSGSVLACEYDEELGRYTWQKFDPENRNLGVAILYGDYEDAPDSIYFGDLKVAGSGKFKFYTRELPVEAQRVEFKLYDKLTGEIFE